MNKNTLFLEYQVKWLQDHSNVKICEKSRRIGLTWAQACDDVLLASTQEGMDVLYISYNLAMTREYIDTCLQWIDKIGIVSKNNEYILKNDNMSEAKTFRIDFESGHKILALTSRPASLRGKQGRVVIDEAAFVENLPQLLKAALALTMWGGQVIVISTHNGIDNPFFELVDEIKKGILPYSLHSIPLHLALEQGLYKRICQTRKIPFSLENQDSWEKDLIALYKDNAEEELYCIPKKAHSAFLPYSLLQSNTCHLAQVIRYSPKAPHKEEFVDLPQQEASAIIQNWFENEVQQSLIKINNFSAFLGIDFGRKNDLTVFWLLIEEKEKLSTYLVLELSNTPFRSQEQILSLICDSLPYLNSVSLDARGNGQALAEYARQYLGKNKVQETMITENWYRTYMPQLKILLENKILSLPQDKEILQDLLSLQSIKGIVKPSDSRKKTQNYSRHCDSAIALVMAIQASHIQEEDNWDCHTIELDSNMLKGF